MGWRNLLAGTMSREMTLRKQEGGDVVTANRMKEFLGYD